MKLLHTTAIFAVLAAASSVRAQSTGVSNPPPALENPLPDDAATAPAKPSAVVAYAPGTTAATRQRTTYGPYVPYNPNGSAAVHQRPRDPDAEIVTSVPTHRAEDDDAGIVTWVASRPNQVPAGTLIATRIRQTVSTAETPVGTRFTAEVTAPMERDGRVIIPAGSTLEGRVSLVRGGRRISGAAAIHLMPESVTLPDGTHYIVHAQVIDTSQHNVTRVDREGTILRRDHVKGTLAAMSLTTGGAAATGAVFGGVPGAFIGAGIGAGVSTVWWLKQDRQEVVPENTGIIFSLSAPMQITPLTVGTN